MSRAVVLMMDAPGALGGVQSVITALAEGFASRGRDVQRWGLWSPDSDHERGSCELVHETEPRLLYSPMTWWQRLKLRVRGQSAGVRVFDEGVARLASLLDARPDAIVVAMQLRSAEYLVAAGINPRRLVIQYHDAFDAARANGDLDRIRLLAPKAGLVLALTAEDARLFREAGIAAVDAVGNPVDVALPATRSSAREPVVVAGARYEPQKALHVLIRAWALASAEHPEWELRLYGEGSLRPQLEAEIARSGARARLCGATEDFVGVLGRASVHALSSVHEGLPMAIAEAMAVGVPTVSTDCAPGVRELVVHGETGLLVPVGDVDALAAALRAVIVDDALRDRLGRAGHAHVRRWERAVILDRWDDLLDARG